MSALAPVEILKFLSKNKRFLLNVKDLESPVVFLASTIMHSPPVNSNF